MDEMFTEMLAVAVQPRPGDHFELQVAQALCVIFVAPQATLRSIRSCGITKRRGSPISKDKGREAGFWKVLRNASNGVLRRAMCTTFHMPGMFCPTVFVIRRRLHRTTGADGRFAAWFQHISDDCSWKKIRVSKMA